MNTYKLIWKIKNGDKYTQEFRNFDSRARVMAAWRTNHPNVGLEDLDSFEIFIKE